MSHKHYTIVNEATGLALEASCSDTGNSVVMRRAHGGDGQRFFKDGSFIRAAPSGTVLDLARHVGGNIVLWEANGGANQRCFTLTALSDLKAATFALMYTEEALMKALASLRIPATAAQTSASC